MQCRSGIDLSGLDALVANILDLDPELGMGLELAAR